MDMAELEEAKQTIEPQALEAQSKLRSLKTDLQVQSSHQRLSWLRLAPTGDHPEAVVLQPRLRGHNLGWRIRVHALESHTTDLGSFPWWCAGRQDERGGRARAV